MARYWVGGGSSANWSATGPTNWGSASGVADNASVPGASDDVIFDGAGVNGNTASTISATITVLSFTVTSGYTSTITHSAPFIVAGNVTLGANYSIAGTSRLDISASSTLTSNGKTWPNELRFSGTNTKTLADDWVVGGILTVNGPTVMNGNTLSINGITSSNGISGTTVIVLTGGTWSSSIAIQSNLIIQGNVTISGTVGYNTGTLTYISGTVTTTASNLVIATSNTTLNTAGITWNNITIQNSLTLTLNSLLSVGGILTINGSINVTFGGTVGFFASVLTAAGTTAHTVTLTEGLEYIVINNLSLAQTRAASMLTITSSHATNRAFLTLRSGALNTLIAHMTRIDATGGRPILTFLGTLTDCKNVFGYTNIINQPIDRLYRGGSRRLDLWNKNRSVEYL